MPYPKTPQRAWFGTYFNVDQPMDWSRHKHCRYAVYQLEKCPDTGRHHFQWYAEFIQPVRAESVSKLFPDTHIEIRKRTRDAARNYCMKSESQLSPPIEYGEWKNGGQGTRTELMEAVDTLAKHGLKRCAEEHPVEYVKFHRGLQSWAQITRKIELPKPDIELYPWQHEVMGILNGPIHHRKIYWIWSYNPAVGKTTFGNYVAATFGLDAFLKGCLEFKELLYLYNNHKIIWFNIPRETPLDAKLSSILEDLSDGGIFNSTKYEPAVKLIHAHIVVTCNRPPPESRLPNRCVEFNVDNK